jgi:hypothetical protein
MRLPWRSNDEPDATTRESAAETPEAPEPSAGPPHIPLDNAIELYEVEKERRERAELARHLADAASAAPSPSPSAVTDDAELAEQDPYAEDAAQFEPHERHWTDYCEPYRDSAGQIKQRFAPSTPGSVILGYLYERIEATEERLEAKEDALKRGTVPAHNRRSALKTIEQLEDQLDNLRERADELEQARGNYEPRRCRWCGLELRNQHHAYEHAAGLEPCEPGSVRESYRDRWTPASGNPYGI